MSASTESRSGLKYDWDIGDNFKPEMDANLLLLGRICFHLSVLRKDLTVTPSSPSAGDTYIIPSSGIIGSWSGNENKIAFYDGSVWVYYTARTGWVAYVEDTKTLAAFDGSNWARSAAFGED